MVLMGFLVAITLQVKFHSDIKLFLSFHHLSDVDELFSYWAMLLPGGEAVASWVTQRGGGGRI